VSCQRNCTGLFISSFNKWSVILFRTEYSSETWTENNCLEYFIYMCLVVNLIPTNKEFLEEHTAGTCLHIVCIHGETSKNYKRSEDKNWLLILQRRAYLVLLIESCKKTGFYLKLKSHLHSCYRIETTMLYPGQTCAFTQQHA
jgi:hypothetical protein